LLVATTKKGGNNNNNNNVNSSKEEFQKYLEKAGVMDALTKVLVGLYEEPDRSQVNALEYLKKYLGAPQAVDVDGLKRENEQLKKEVEKLKRQLQQAQKQQSGGEVEC
jgi:predicted ATP-grasp superfamily ATP-dependent carboligase